MRRREFMLAMGAAGMALTGCRTVRSGAAPAGAPATGAAPASARPPHIVYILADDLGYGDVNCFNPESKISTPSIDALAAAGLRCTDAHSGSAVCTPTRYGVLTGRYCWRTSLQRGVLHGYSPALLEPQRLTVPALLKRHGYATACVGKWHLGLGWGRKDGARTATAPAEADVDFTRPLSAGPHTVGFDYSYIIPASLDMDPYVYLENGQVTELPTARVANSPRPAYWRGGLCAPSFKHETCLYELTRRAEAFLDGRAARKDQPFFLYFALTSPHTPHVPRAEFRGKSRAGNYGDFVVETDWSVGRILDALKRRGLADDTLVILTSDNGSHTQPLGLEEAYGHRGNAIYRGQKSDAWDGGHRVPFVAQWPGRIRAGSTCAQTLCLTDLLATSAAIVGAPVPDDAGEDSVDILPLLTGQTDQPAREATVHHSINGEFAIRQGPWKLVRCKGSGGWSQPEKSAPAGAPPGQLYDMRDDPREQRNLYSERPEVVARLTELLEKYRREGRSVPRRSA